MHRGFLKIYDDYFDDIYRYVLFKTNSKWDTDDLVSEIFRKAYEKYPTINGNKKAWLFTIVKNTVIDFYRKKKDIASSDKLDRFTYPGCFELDVEKDEQIDYLKKSLALLSEEELEIINLRYFSDMKYKDIGELYGRSGNSIKMKIMRVTRKLNELINKYMEV